MLTSGVAAQLYTLRDFLTTPADIASTLRKVKAIGYRAVQLSGVGPIPPQELAAVLQGEGLQAIITHIPYVRLRDELDAVIAEHHLWACPHVAIGALPPEYRSAEGYVAFAAIASDIARRLHDAGLTFSYHNHSFEFERINGCTGLELFFEHADPLVLAELDTYWVQHGGASPAAWIRKLAGRMAVIHLKDMAIAHNEQIMAEVGEGNLDWPDILQACREAGVQWYAVEQDTCQRDPFESLAISLRHLRDWGLTDQEQS
jgi:sugar phosphate isomerase/epimerase